jgi:hypothetical protein
MLLDAYDLDIFNKTNQTVQVWRTTETSTGSSGDLRRVFPILVAGSGAYIGKNTGQNVEIILKENDKEVKKIKGISK